MPASALMVMLTLGLVTAGDAAASPPNPPAVGSSGSNGSPGVGVALYALSPLALGLGYVGLSLAEDPIDAGLSVFYGIAGTAGLAAVGAHEYMRSRTGVEPRWWAWWASFVPLAATTVLTVYTPLVDRPAPVLGAGLALTVASFGVVAFTDLGYSAAPGESVGISRAIVAPQVLVVRAARGSKPALGVNLVF